jgi:hypothetical protein
MSRVPPMVTRPSERSHRVLVDSEDHLIFEATDLLAMIQTAASRPRSR